MTGTIHDEELRLALVLNGGVSLAVWIGGVCHEVNRLVRKESAYKELLALSATQARVDVICGTSAGGINGAFLAMALAHDRPLDSLRNLWLERGSFRSLLRNPLHKDLPSLLDGDGYFLPQLEAAFRGLKSSPPTSPNDVPLELIITATLLGPEPRMLVDDLGLPIADATHKGTFHFSRGPGLEDDPFVGDAAVKRLALAARSSASFPGAFEASFCRVGGIPTPRTDMARVASFKSSQWVIDGGVLDNKPIKPALKAIFAQRANREVRRVLLYVVPDPGSESLSAEVSPDKPPNSARVVLASLTELPRAESVSEELAYIHEQNRRVETQRRKRNSLTATLAPEALEALAATLFPTYRAHRTDSALQYILGEIDLGLARHHGRGLGHRGRREWLARALEQEELPWVPSKAPVGLPSADLAQATWQWGTLPVERSARLVLDVLRRFQRLVTALHVDEPALPALWSRAFDRVSRMERIRNVDRNYWQERASALIAVMGYEASSLPQSLPFSEQVRVWFQKALAEWQQADVGEESEAPPRTRSALAGRLMYELAEILVRAKGLVGHLKQPLDAAKDVLLNEEHRNFVRHVSFLVPESATREVVVQRLLQFHLIELTFGEEPPEVEQLVELVQVSADGASPCGGPDVAAEKLTGIQLGHFGAFYKRSWRANDWMYGRLDAVRRYVNVLLHPGRLRILHGRSANGAQKVFERLHEIAVPKTADDPSRAYLENAWVSSRNAIQAELAYLDSPDHIVPELLPACADAVTRRLHVEILEEELSELAASARQDVAHKADPLAPGSAFAEEYLQLRAHGIQVSGKELLELFSRSRVGAERIRNEIGSDLFTATSTHALAVAISACYSAQSGLGPLRRVFLALRAPALAAQFFAHVALKRSHTAGVLLAMALTFSLTVLAMALLTRSSPPTLLFIAAVVALCGGVVGILAWQRWLSVMLLLLCIIGFSVAQWLGGITISPPTLEQWRTLALLQGVLLILLALGAFRWPKVLVSLAAWFRMRLAALKRPRSG